MPGVLVIIHVDPAVKPEQGDTMEMSLAQEPPQKLIQIGAVMVSYFTPRDITPKLVYI